VMHRGMAVVAKREIAESDRNVHQGKVQKSVQRPIKPAPKRPLPISPRSKPWRRRIARARRDVATKSPARWPFPPDARGQRSCQFPMPSLRDEGYNVSVNRWQDRVLVTAGARNNEARGAPKSCRAAWRQHFGRRFWLFETFCARLYAEADSLPWPRLAKRKTYPHPLSLFVSAVSRS
jgi:hypothetical protein